MYQAAKLIFDECNKNPRVLRCYRAHQVTQEEVNFISDLIDSHVCVTCKYGFYCIPKEEIRTEIGIQG